MVPFYANRQDMGLDMADPCRRFRKFCNTQDEDKCPCLRLEWHMADLEMMETAIREVFSRDTMKVTWGRRLWHDGTDPRDFVWVKESDSVKRRLVGTQFYTAESTCTEDGR